MGIDKFYQKGVFPALEVGGVEYFGGTYPIAGKTYFVSKNGNNSNGLNWKNAFTTIGEAIAAVNAYVLTNNYAMCRIYIDGGNYSESLVTFPNHCDMIGVGVPFGARLAASTLLTSVLMACRMYNMQFRTPTGGVPVLKFFAGSQGIELHNCMIFGNAVEPSIGLEFGDVCYQNKVIGCKFPGISNSALIAIQFDGQNNNNTEIRDNFISAVTKGIYLASDNGASYSDYGVVIQDNIITRSDPNSGSQLVTGIDIADTQSRTDAMIIHNYISAATPINGADASKVIDNHVNIAGNGKVLTEEETA